jgi:hypothetical protein
MQGAGQMTSKQWFLIAVAGTMFSALASASEFGEQIASEISVTSYQQCLDNQLYTHAGANRGRNGAQHNPCRSNIAALMTSYGLTVQLQSFTYGGQTYYNVVGTQTGVLYPNVQYVVGAHYDSVSNPGADDNASGVAGVLEAARVLSQYDMPYTIKYIAFDLEELGLLGSAAYVAAHHNDDIRGMVSLDMIAWSGSAGKVDIYAEMPSRFFRNAVRRAIRDYGAGVTVGYEGSSNSSDHASFEDAGIPGCLLIENRYHANPCYHQSCDNVDNAGYLDYELAANVTRAMAGFLADPDDEYCVGDVSADGRIDLSDLAALLAHYGMTSGAEITDGDVDGDGDVDLSDLALLLSLYGTAC